MIIQKNFKRGCIYFNTATNRPERVVTITATTLGTKAGTFEPIEIHPREDFRSPSAAEIRAYLGSVGKFAKTATMITDADSTAIAYGEKVVIVANTSPKLAKIRAAVEAKNMRSLAQLISEKRAAKKVKGVDTICHPPAAIMISDS